MWKGGKFSRSTLLSSVLAIYVTAHAQFRPYYYYFQLKSDVILNSQHPFSPSFRARDTMIDDFCDDNICACTLTMTIILPVANLSPEMDSVTAISYTKRRIYNSPVNQRLMAVKLCACTYIASGCVNERTCSFPWQNESTYQTW